MLEMLRMLEMRGMLGMLFYTADDVAPRDMARCEWPVGPMRLDNRQIGERHGASEFSASTLEISTSAFDIYIISLSTTSLNLTARAFHRKSAVLSTTTVRVAR